MAQQRPQQHERRVRPPIKPQSAKRETCAARYASSKRRRIMMVECIDHKKTKKAFTVEELTERGLTKVG